MLWAKPTNLKSTNAADCQGKDEIISEPGWACGTTCQLLIISSFHLYPCKFAPFHTVIVIHTIWRRLLQRFMSVMTLWCVMRFSARESPPSLHNRWNHLDECQNFFFFVTVFAFWPNKFRQYFAMSCSFILVHFIWTEITYNFIPQKINS